jgi:natural product precursor
MKKIKLDGKLKLNKETIAKLNDEKMEMIKGGSDRLCTNIPCATLGCPTALSTCCVGG